MCATFIVGKHGPGNPNDAIPREYHIYILLYVRCTYVFPRTVCSVCTIIRYVPKPGEARLGSFLWKFIGAATRPIAGPYILRTRGRLTVLYTYNMYYYTHMYACEYRSRPTTDEKRTPLLINPSTTGSRP